MLITVLVMAFAVSLEPFRIGMAALMLSRPRPLLQLAVFLLGGYLMGLTVGLTVLFVFRRRLLGSGYFTLPTVQLALGALALLAAAAVVTVDRWWGPHRERPAPRARQWLNGRSLWVAGAAGLGIALPSVDYLAVLAVILASHAAAITQIGALLMFHVVAFSAVEIPLLAYVFAPRATRTSIAAVNDWIRSRRRVEVAALLAVVGVLLLAAGIAGR